MDIKHEYCIAGYFQGGNFHECLMIPLFTGKFHEQVFMVILKLEPTILLPEWLLMCNKSANYWTHGCSYIHDSTCYTVNIIVLVIYTSLLKESYPHMARTLPLLLYSDRNFSVGAYALKAFGHTRLQYSR